MYLLEFRKLAILLSDFLNDKSDLFISIPLKLSLLDISCTSQLLCSVGKIFEVMFYVDEGKSRFFFNEIVLLLMEFIFSIVYFLI